MLFLKLVHTEFQLNHKTQLFWVKAVHLVPNVQTLAGHAIGTNDMLSYIEFEHWVLDEPP